LEGSAVVGFNFNYLAFQYFEGVIVFNATFNNISVISWLSILLEEETELPGKNH
jgi:hypothetical protein